MSAYMRAAASTIAATQAKSGTLMGGCEGEGIGGGEEELPACTAFEAISTSSEALMLLATKPASEMPARVRGAVNGKSPFHRVR